MWWGVRYEEVWRHSIIVKAIIHIIGPLICASVDPFNESLIFCPRKRETFFFIPFSAPYGITRQKKLTWRLFSHWMASNVYSSAQHHRMPCIINAFEQFGVLYRHNYEHKYPARPRFEPYIYISKLWPIVAAPFCPTIKHLRNYRDTYSVWHHYSTSPEGDTNNSFSSHSKLIDKLHLFFTH